MSEHQFPQGWALSAIQNLTSADGLISDGDWVESKDQDPNGSIRLIQLADIGDDDFRNKSNRFMSEDKATLLNCTFLEEGDVLVARMPDPLGRACLFSGVGQPAVTVVDVCLIRVGTSSALTNQLLKYWINSPSFRGLISENASGTTRKRITRKKLERFEVPVPPLAEQKVITDKVGTLLVQVENTKARLERIPQILKRFRQSVLAAAVSGRLTEAAHASSWKQVTVGQIASDIRYGTSKKCSESTGSTPVLRIPNIGDGYVLQSNLKFADFEEKERAKLSLKQGDLLLIRSNGSLDLVGKTALVREIDSGLLYAGYLIRLRLDEQVADPAYVSLCLRSPETRAVIEEKARSTSGVNNVNSKELASLELSLPSTAVQQEIVRRVDQLFAHADRIEQQVNNALACVNNLAQSILAKAFRGELTEQWRKDNPGLISGENSAEALLERIKTERAAMKKPAKKTRKQTTA